MDDAKKDLLTDVDANPADATEIDPADQTSAPDAGQPAEPAAEPAPESVPVAAAPKNRKPAKAKSERPGARKRAKRATSEAPEAKELAPVYLLTSRFVAKHDGRSVARRKVAMVDVERIEGLFAVDFAREATEAEIAAAQAAGPIPELA